jgi:protein O-GlcNAc transferase
MQKPCLTFPLEIADYVSKVFDHGSVILEYGSGGSTVLAAEKPKKIIYSVESDRKWALRMRLYFAANKFNSIPLMYWVDIGETCEWGGAANELFWKNFYNYSTGIWYENFFRQPDVILIDGRFRVACFLATLALTERSVMVLFDDYKERSFYHVAEEFYPVVEFVGRMAVFDIRPAKIDARKLLAKIPFFYDQR